MVQLPALISLVGSSLQPRTHAATRQQGAGYPQAAFDAANEPAPAKCHSNRHMPSYRLIAASGPSGLVLNSTHGRKSLGCNAFRGGSDVSSGGPVRLRTALHSERSAPSVKNLYSKAKKLPASHVSRALNMRQARATAEWQCSCDSKAVVTEAGLRPRQSAPLCVRNRFWGGADDPRRLLPHFNLSGDGCNKPCVGP
jgi:hypothetical protein